MNQDLTTLAKFKAWYNIPSTSTTDDDLLQDIIDSASGDILAYLDRKSLFKNTYPEYKNGTGGQQMMLLQWPVLSVASVTVDGVPQTAAVQPNTGYFIDTWDGWPPGRPQYVSFIGGMGAGYPLISPPVNGGGNVFTRGVKNVYINYTAGYAVQNEAGTIPTLPYQLTAAQSAGRWAQDDGLTIAGVAGIAVTGTPVTGQYSVSSGVYTFAAADTGKAVLINYSYVPKAIEQACNMLVGEQYSYRQRIGQKSHTLGGQVTTSFDNSIVTPMIVKKLQPFMRMVPY